MTVGVSLKTYFGHAAARQWCATVAATAGRHPAVLAGDVALFVAPTYLVVPAALEAFAGTPVAVAAQDVGADGPGAFTGEVSAAELAEVGVRFAEVGHAERRRLFAEDDATVAAKAAASVRHGITPVVCVGEPDRGDEAAAARDTVAQLRRSLDGVPAGPVVVAYEPVWAIGAAAPAGPAHIRAVCRAVGQALDADGRRGSARVVYGGSAGPGLLAEIADDVDGLFLGRRAHDPAALLAVVDEAAAVAGR